MLAGCRRSIFLSSTATVAGTWSTAMYGHTSASIAPVTAATAAHAHGDAGEHGGQYESDSHIKNVHPDFVAGVAQHGRLEHFAAFCQCVASYVGRLDVARHRREEEPEAYFHARGLGETETVVLAVARNVGQGRLLQRRHGVVRILACIDGVDQANAFDAENYECQHDDDIRQWSEILLAQGHGKYNSQDCQQYTDQYSPEHIHFFVPS